MKARNPKASPLYKSYKRKVVESFFDKLPIILFTYEIPLYMVVHTVSNFGRRSMCL